MSRYGNYRNDKWERMIELRKYLNFKRRQELKVKRKKRLFTKKQKI